jgi:hypothetical protein
VVRRILTSLGGASLAITVLVALGVGSSARAASTPKARAAVASIQVSSALDHGAVVLACESAEDSDYDDLTLDVVLDPPRSCELGSNVTASSDEPRDGLAPRHRASRVSTARGPPA